MTDDLVKRLRQPTGLNAVTQEPVQDKLNMAAADRIEELEAENKNLRHMIIDQIEGAGDDPEIMAASRAEWAARAKAAEAKLAWQPIETAPKDGTYIIVVPYGDVNDLQVSWFIGDEGRWANWDWLVEPTHWMPMPTPPSQN